MMLDDIRILNFTHFIMGSCAAQYLADLGAKVVKVEPLSGAFERRMSCLDLFIEGESMFFLLSNRNQDSLAIDLKKEEGLKIIKELIKEYDVLIENYRPGVMERLGLGYEEVHELNPRLIYCSCSGYGERGKYATRPGQDVLVQSLTGLASYSGRRPKPLGVTVIDQHGAVLAAMGILASLYRRERTGEGGKVDTSLLAASLDLQQETLAYKMNGGAFNELGENGLCTRIRKAPDGTYRTRDGYITVTLIPLETLKRIDSSFQIFEEKDQIERAAEVDAAFARAIEKRTTKECMKLFRELDIWYEEVLDYDGLLANRDIMENVNIQHLDREGALVRVVGHPNRYDGVFPQIGKAPPKLGDAAEKLLKELHYNEAEIERLESDGVIRIDRTRR